MATEIRAPYAYFTERDGRPLEAGYIYTGVENLNPLASPLQAYWDVAMTIPAYNVRTTSGYPANVGSPGRLYVPGNYSILVQDRNHVTVFYCLSMQGYPIVSDVLELAKKTAVEYGKPIGEIFALPEYRDPTAYDIANPRTYFPAVCLTGMDNDSAVISSAHWPEFVPWLLTQKTAVKSGITGSISAFPTSNWAVASNVGSITLANTLEVIILCAAMVDDEVGAGGWADWRTITLNSSIGGIIAGTYQISGWNATTRVVSFPYVSADDSGAVVSTVEFYPHKIVGSTNTARIWSMKGNQIIGVNDPGNRYVLTCRKRAVDVGATAGAMDVLGSHIYQFGGIYLP